MAKGMKFTAEMLQKGLLKKMFGWADLVLKEHIPSDIYGKCHSPVPSEKMRGLRWIQERGYRIATPGEGVVQVFRGTKLLRQTKMVLELDDPEDLLQMAEVVKGNENIPPPPWQPK